MNKITPEMEAAANRQGFTYKQNSPAPKNKKHPFPWKGAAKASAIVVLPVLAAEVIVYSITGITGAAGNVACGFLTLFAAVWGWFAAIIITRR